MKSTHETQEPMTIVFAQRPPTLIEFERLRLVLSTYQDGSGMNAIMRRYEWHQINNARTTPGWRDFETAVSATFGGVASENKHVYDVSFSIPDRPGVEYGISCKMRGELRTAARNGRGYIELTNAAQALWSAVKSLSELDETNYTSNPGAVGAALIYQVEEWHWRHDYRKGGKYDTDHCAFLNLLFNPRSGEYQLFQFPIHLPKANKLQWSHRSATIIGSDGDGIVFEWYPLSGGQLKYYPPIKHASWSSTTFKLEPLPQNITDVSLQKAESYFPARWQLLLKPE